MLPAVLNATVAYPTRRLPIIPEHDDVPIKPGNRRLGKNGDFN